MHYPRISFMVHNSNTPWAACHHVPGTRGAPYTTSVHVLLFAKQQETIRLITVLKEEKTQEGKIIQ